MACPEHSSHDKTNISLKYFCSFLQLPTASFPVVVKMGHAHSGMGKVGADDVNTHCTLIGPRVCVSELVYMVYEDTDLYNNMGITT